jgi:hypothetical protein
MTSQLLTTAHRFRIYITISVVIVLGMAALSVYSYAEWSKKNYFGKVLQVDEHSIVVSDRNVGQRQILIDERTKIRQGRGVVAELSVGQDVVIVAEKDAGGYIVAALIRVVMPPRQ